MPRPPLPRYLTVLLGATVLGVAVGLLVAFLRRPSPAVAVGPSAELGAAAGRSPASPGIPPARGETATTASRRRPPTFVRTFERIPEPFTEGTSLIDAYNRQRINPLWAPRMEAELRKRFEDNPPAAAGLEAMTISVVECRDNSCRVDFTYPASMLQLPPPPGFPDRHVSPVDIYLWRTGAFATYLKNLPPTQLPDGTTTETAIVAFKGPTVDPETYQTWARARTEVARKASSSQEKQEVNR